VDGGSKGEEGPRLPTGRPRQDGSFIKPRHRGRNQAAVHRPLRERWDSHGQAGVRGNSCLSLPVASREADSTREDIRAKIPSDPRQPGNITRALAFRAPNDIRHSCRTAVSHAPSSARSRYDLIERKVVTVGLSRAHLDEELALRV